MTEKEIKKEEIKEDTSIEAFVLDNCIEWSNILSELCKKEFELLALKTDYNNKEFELLTTFDFKREYGKDNEKIRKGHLRKVYKDLLEDIEDLELSIDYLKRRLTYLKGLVTVKTALIDAKKKE